MVYPVEKLRNNSEGSAYSKFAEAKWSGRDFLFAASLEGCKEKAGNPWGFPAVVNVF